MLVRTTADVHTAVQHLARSDYPLGNLEGFRSGTVKRKGEQETVMRMEGVFTHLILSIRAELLRCSGTSCSELVQWEMFVSQLKINHVVDVSIAQGGMCIEFVCSIWSLGSFTDATPTIQKEKEYVERKPYLDYDPEFHRTFKKQRPLRSRQARLSPSKQQPQTFRSG
jgi:hypothetical protein